ncbi:MAG: DUF2237 domain-containing protein [Pirellulaceae bacterium]
MSLLFYLTMRESYYMGAKNVLGGELETCSMSPRTGFFRDGCCRTGAEDVGLHIVCAEMTDEFLKFSKSRGNDLSTPIPAYDFPGLVAGDRWCLCALRWREALEAGMAPKVNLRATHISSLEFIDLEDLQRHAVDDD